LGLEARNRSHALPPAQQSYVAKPWLVVGAVKILATNEVVYTSLANREPGQVNRASSILYSAGLVSIPTGAVHSPPRDQSVVPRNNQDQAGSPFPARCGMSMRPWDFENTVPVASLGFTR
jgi:hypothetical protein